MLTGRTIILGVSGGIAAYKAATICSSLTKAGAQVKVVMTAAAKEFIQPLTFQAISRFPVYSDTFDEQDPSVIAHIDLADSADLVLIAPATANLIAKLAHGLADDMLTTTCLASRAPVFVAPAMNVHMYGHPAVQRNLEQLEQWGIRLIEPGEGPLACGYNGKGRLAEPEQIIEEVIHYFQQQDGRPKTAEKLKDRKLLVTAGGTRERIDPVRYIGNDSSGKMGFAIAAAAARLGMQVCLVSGPVMLDTPAGVERIDVETAEQMHHIVLNKAPSMDVIIKAAAVADYRPAKQHEQKIKKSESELVIALRRTPDILQALGQMENKPYLVGFAAETEKLHQHAKEKLAKKQCDMIVANDVSKPGAGFNADDNAITVFEANGETHSIGLKPKSEIAYELLDLIAQRAF